MTIEVPNLFANAGTGNAGPPPGVRSTPVSELDANFAFVFSSISTNSPSLGISYGGTPGGADATAAVLAASAAGSRTLLGPGVFSTTIPNGEALTGNFWGQGQVQTADNNRHAPWFSALSTVPTSQGNPNSIDTTFNGDLSHVQIALEQRWTGTSIPDPVTGYAVINETAPVLISVANQSGANHSKTSNDGRTAAAIFRVIPHNIGQGDLIPFYVSGDVNGANPGATTWLANPAVSIICGDLTADAPAVYLNPAEWNLILGSNDAAAVGYVVNIDRNVGDTLAGLGAFTGGFRAQSTGTYPVDSALSATGHVKVPVDLSMWQADANKSWGAVPVDTYLYGAATSSDGFKATALGSHKIGVSSGGFWNIVFNNASALQVSDTQITANTTLVWFPNTGAATPGLTVNGEFTVTMTSNTAGFLWFRGTDGVIRKAAIGPFA